MSARRFELHREHDVSGVSGTGVVADGMEFPDGAVALRWRSAWPTSVVFHDRGIASVEAIHGHGGATRVVWIPDAPAQPTPAPVDGDAVERARAAGLAEFLRRSDDGVTSSPREHLHAIVDAALAAARDGEADGDEHHTMDELYEYRMLYNAHAAHGWLAAGIPVVKSWKHSDGEPCFGGGWFIVVATLPTGQVSNHYAAEHWDLFAVPAVDLPPEYDGHTPQVAAERLREALTARAAGDGAEVDREALAWRGAVRAYPTEHIGHDRPVPSTCRCDECYRREGQRNAYIAGFLAARGDAAVPSVTAEQVREVLHAWCGDDDAPEAEDAWRLVRDLRALIGDEVAP